MKLDLTKLRSYICYYGAEYYASQPDFKAAWQNCERGDWMLYIIASLNIDNRIITLCAGHIAKTVLHLMRDFCSVAAVNGAIAYGEGKIDMTRLKLLRVDAAKAASAHAAASAGAAAASSAVYAAKTAHTAVYAAHTAVYAADAAADAAVYAASSATATYTASLKQSADICREILTGEVFAAIDKIENNN